MDDKDIRVKQAARIILNYMVEEALIDIGGDEVKRSIKQSMRLIDSQKNIKSFQNHPSQKVGTSD